MKKARNLLALLLICMMLITGCAGDSNTGSSNGNADDIQQSANSDTSSRTDLKLSVASEITSLDPFKWQALPIHMVTLMIITSKYAKFHLDFRHDFRQYAGN